jgi:hypothetical protein
MIHLSGLRPSLCKRPRRPCFPPCLHLRTLPLETELSIALRSNWPDLGIAETAWRTPVMPRPHQGQPCERESEMLRKSKAAELFVAASGGPLFPWPMTPPPRARPTRKHTSPNPPTAPVFFVECGSLRQSSPILKGSSDSHRSCATSWMRSSLSREVSNLTSTL